MREGIKPYGFSCRLGRGEHQPGVVAKPRGSGWECVECPLEGY